MKKSLGRRNRMRLTALVLGGMLYGGTVSAATLVSTIPSDYANSEMGTATGSRVTTHVDAEPQAGVLQNLNGDPASFGFWQKGESKLYLRQYTYSVTQLENLQIIDPNSSGAAAAAAAGKITAVPNAYAAASDNHIYAMGYDLGKLGTARRGGNREEQTTTEFTKRLFGTDSDQEYIDAHVRQADGTYRFTKDSTITYKNGSDMNMGAIKPNVDVTIDAAERTLTVKTGGKTASVKESAAIWNDGKNLDITAGTLQLQADDSTSAAPLEKASGIRTTGSSVTTIKGKTEIDVGGTKVSRAVQALGGTVTLDSLSAKINADSEDAATLFAQNDGRISVNIKYDEAGSGKVALDGNIVAKDAASQIDVGLLGEEAYLKGFAFGEGKINMQMLGGAAWHNEKQGAALPAGFTGSRLSSLRGGPNKTSLALIFQNDDRNITIDEYKGHAKVFYAHDAASPTQIKGGDLVIHKAARRSNITLTTDSSGLNMEATDIDGKNLVSATLNALANKLIYTAYTTGERNLQGNVEIAEGLTASSASKRVETITFDEATGKGGYAYIPLIEPPPSQTTAEFTTGITGEETKDVEYINAGVRKPDGQYIFTKDSKITAGKTMIGGGAWMNSISAAISNTNTEKPLNIDLNGKNLMINTKTDVSTTGITAIGKVSKVHIKNAGAISIDAESTNYGQTATLFVNGGGAIHIENGGSNLEDKVLKVRANGNAKANVAVIKSMNGVTGAESNITIDGLVDVLADGDDATNGKGANEAVSAVASTIDIGGGTIRAINGAWAAIRAYGEFVSDNYGTVNFNVTKGMDGLANGAGTNRAVIEGDIVTNGGMGTKGRVSVGLSTADSHWEGNYADTRGYGVTPGQLGAVNLFMKNGSYWKGFSNGSMKVEMSGDGTKWTGFNLGENLQLQLADGAIWHNAITPEQTDQSNNPAISRVKYFTGQGGFIDMTGENRFLASSNSLSGAPVQTGSSAIEEKGLGETGDLTIENYSGNTKVLYRHDAASPTTIFGGKLTIKKAEAGSAITLTTDSAGLNTESTAAADKNLVSATLNALANKLWYEAYTTNERNLTGKAEIAEGLTTSSASKRMEDITFSEATGQGSYVYTPEAEGQTTTQFTKRILGTTADQEYIDAHVRQADGTYRFTKDSTIMYDTVTDTGAGAIAPEADLHIDASGHALTVHTNIMPPATEEAAAIKNDGRNINIKADKTSLFVNMNAHILSQRAKGIFNQSGTINISGMTEIGVTTASSVRAVEAEAGTVTLEGLQAFLSMDGEATAILAGTAGRININAKDGIAGDSSVNINGNVGAMGEASRIDIAMVKEGSNLNGLAFGKGTINFWLQNGAEWSNNRYGSIVPNESENEFGQGYGYTYAGSRLTSLTGGSDAGHAGVIRQAADEDITIDNYSGHTRVFYEHGASTPTRIKGGAFRIKNAAAGSAITLTTDNSGLNTEATSGADKALVDNTLNALANKLWYMAYTTGERNLTGKAEIAEGLTTSAASKRIEDITFDETSGQGRYGNVAPPSPGNEQTKTEFTTRLLGTDADQEYIEANVRQADGTYRFTKDSRISYENAEEENIGVIRPLEDVKMDASEHTLVVATNTEDDGKTAAIKNSGKNLDIKANTLRLLANETEEKYPAYSWGILHESGTTTVVGMTEIEAVGYTSSRAVEAKDGTVALEGLKAKVAPYNEAQALLAGTSGQIFANVKNGVTGNNLVKLDGNVGAMGEASRIDIAMVNEASGLNGLAFGKGEINFWLQGGAVWNNEQYGYSVPDKETDGLGKDYDYTFTGSRLTSLQGGNDAGHAGAIFQKNDFDISIDNYSGHTRVFYEHEDLEPTTMIGGDFRIKNAAVGSSVTLTTDSTGLNTGSAKAADKNLVSATLNALANKLWYTAYTTGERNLTGKAEIAEGLTTSSASKRIEDITFDETSGQGSYIYTPAVDPEQTKTEFTTRIFGTDADQEYIDANVRLSDGTYHFTKDSSITYQNDADADQGTIKPSADVHIDAAERVLTVKSGGRTASVKEAAAITNDGRTVDIKAKALKLLVSDTTSAAPLQSAWGILSTGGTTNISGMTEIEVGGTKVSKAVQASGGTVTFEGLSAKTNAASDDAAALFAQNDGRISVNVKGGDPGNNTVALDGNIAAKDAASYVDVALRGESSYLKGIAYGDGTINMWLQPGAVWQNGKQGATLPAGFAGSRINRFVGGYAPNQAGAIFQNDDQNITIGTYHGYTKVFFAHDSATPTNIKGGDIVIGKSLGGSSITLITDNAGLNTEATAVAEKNLVSETLNALANKLWYTAYTTGERSLGGKVQIAEGLTTSAASKRIGDITFDETTGRGGYIYTPLIDPPASQTDTAFTTSITGDEMHDAPYFNAGVRKTDGKYIFTKDSTITTGKDLIVAGAWMSNISAAVSSASGGKTLDVDLNGKNLAIKTVTDVSTTGISSIGQGSKVNIKNAGAISIDAESTGGGQTATLFVNGGGAIHIENGGSNLEDKVLKVRANGNYKTNVAVIKSMNGVTGVESNITIDGLVDVLADGDAATNGKGANEAVSAVASTIDIGGGSIRAINGAWAAIRAYGEFVSANYGTVNFNVTKGADGLANGAGTNRAVIEGDIVTNGGMGTKGRVSVGLSTADSHWLGNYADTSGYGVTPGQLGAVNLFMKNGSYWKGFSNGSMKVEMSGEGTSWTGFNVGQKLQLQLSDGAIWHNAITPEQKDQSNNPAISRVKYFTGQGGFIDMTGTNRFLALSHSLSGAPVQTGSSSIEEKGLGETGNLEIENYSGNTKVLYRHDAASPTTIFGGKLTIKKAEAGSAITLTTDSAGLNTESTAAADKNLVSATLNALANKLWYEAYTTNERNLTGKAEIAEGLTTSSASKRMEDITFNETTGQGSYVYTPAVDPPPSTEQTKTEFTSQITSQNVAEYVDDHVEKTPGVYTFTKDTTIKHSEFQGAIRGDKDPVTVNAEGKTLTIESSLAGMGALTGIYHYGTGFASSDPSGDLNISAATLNLNIKGKGGRTFAVFNAGNGLLRIKGQTNIDISGGNDDGDEVSGIEAISKGTTILEGLTIRQAKSTDDHRAIGNKGITSKIYVNVDEAGNVGSHKVDIQGNVLTDGHQALTNVALTTADSKLHGVARVQLGTLNLWLQNGATWMNENYGTGTGRYASALTKLTGGSDAAHVGVIFQQNTKDITIDHYSGHTKVFYAHDAATPTTMKGGDFRISAAAVGSVITLTTDSVGLNTESTAAADKNLVSETLNALANKLWYIAYTTGERNLTGKAEIAEGLTTSSASKRVEDITFNETTGQGSYVYTPAVDPPPGPNPGEQTQTAFTTPITGDEATDTDYVAGGVLRDSKYTFAKNSKITATSGIEATAGKPITVEATGTELEIQAAQYGLDAAANSKIAFTGKRLAVEAGSLSIRAAAGAEVSITSGFDLKGAIENTGGRISLLDTGRTSSLQGDITQTDGDFGLKLRGVNSKLESKIVSSGGLFDVSLEGAGATFTGSIRGSGSAQLAGTGERRLTLENKTIWNVTAPSNLTKLNAKPGSIINYLFSHDEGVNIEKFQGSATVHYDGTATADGTLTLNNTGKFRVRDVEGTGNTLTIATNASAGSDAADEKVATSLAKQFAYVGDRSKIQDRKIQGLSLGALIADGMTASAKRYNVFMGADGTPEGIKPFVSNVEYGDYETMVMQSAKGAMTSSAMVWRNEMNDVMKRMGDLRLSPGDLGGWVRFYKGRTSSDKAKATFRMNFNTIQAGYDWKAGQDWRVGIAGSYMKGSSSYATGSGDNKAGNFAVYGTWTGESGQYVDLIAKVGRVSNSFNAANAWGNVRVTGEYSTWGESISAEYGRRFKTDGSFYFEPQVELTFGRLNGADYDMASNGYGTLHVHQSGMNSAIGRLGIALGQETEKATWFVKASLYREFGGGMDTAWEVEGNPTKYTRQEGKDTWLALQLGGTVKLNDGLSLYGDFEKTFSGDIKTDWRIDAGLRWSF